MTRVNYMQNIMNFMHKNHGKALRHLFVFGDVVTDKNPILWYSNTINRKE